MDRRTLSHENLVDDLPAYVLGTLDLGRCEDMAAHLADCPACQAEQRRIEHVLAALGTLAPPAEPPDSLRSSLLARLTEPTASPEPRAPEAPRRDTVAGTVRPTTPRWVRFALMAAAVLVIALGGWATVMTRNLWQAQDVLAAIQRTNDQAAVVLSQQPRVVPMIADAPADASGTLYLSSENTRALLAVSNLRPSPPGRVYQVWLVRGETRTSAGVFRTDTSGASQLVIESPQPLSNYDAVGITEEPAPDGSPGPTSPRIIGCPLR